MSRITCMRSATEPSGAMVQSASMSAMRCTIGATSAIVAWIVTWPSTTTEPSSDVAMALTSPASTLPSSRIASSPNEATGASSSSARSSIDSGLAMTSSSSTSTPTSYARA